MIEYVIKDLKGNGHIVKQKITRVSKRDFVRNLSFYLKKPGIYELEVKGLVKHVVDIASFDVEASNLKDNKNNEYFAHLP